MPTICKISLDAEEYRKELQKIIEETKAASKKMTSSGDDGKTSVVKVDVSGTESLLEVSEEVKNLPEMKTITVKTISEESKYRIREMKDGFGSLSIPVQNFKEKAVSGLKSVWQEMTNLQSGAKKLSSLIAGGGGAIGVLIAGAIGAYKAVMAIIDNWKQKLKDNAEQHRENASEIRRVSEANQQLRQKTDESLNSLSSLAAKEKLSNTEKAEALKLIRELTSAYGDLGIRLNKTTGELSGVDSAMVAKLQKDRDSAIRELKNEDRTLAAEKSDQMDIVNSKVSLFNDFNAASARIRESDVRRGEIGRKLLELRGSDPSGNYLERRKGENADLQKSGEDRYKNLLTRSKEDSFSDEKELAKKIGNRKKLLEEQEKLQKELGDKEEKARFDVQTAQNRKDDPGAVEAETKLLKILHERQDAEEKIYELKLQIKRLENSRDEAVQKMATQTQFEIEYNKLILNGEYDKAEALKLQNRFREQGMKLSKEELDAQLKRQKEQKSLTLGENLRGQAENLNDSAMKNAGLGRQAEREKSIRSAERLKGAELTKDEREMVERLFELTHRINNPGRSAIDSISNLSIQTNSLTSRGGFASGAVGHDKDRINRAIESHTQNMLRIQKDTLRALQDVKDLLKT